MAMLDTIHKLKPLGASYKDFACIERRTKVRGGASGTLFESVN